MLRRNFLKYLPFLNSLSLLPFTKIRQSKAETKLSIPSRYSLLDYIAEKTGSSKSEVVLNAFGESESISLSGQILQHAWHYVLDDDEILEEFYEWFVPIAWDIDGAEVDSNTIELVYQIELEFAEFTGGYKTENELRNDLHLILEQHHVKCITPSNKDWQEFAKHNRPPKEWFEGEMECPF